MTKSGKIIIIGLLVLVILALAVFGILLYFQGKTLPLLNKIVTVPLVELSPDEVIKVMQKQMIFLKTAHYELVADIKFLSSETPVAVKTQANFDGGFLEGLTGQLVMSSEITLQNFNYLANFEVRSTKEKSYFRVTEVPAVPFVDLGEIENKWYVYISKTSSDDYVQTFLKVQTLLLNNELFTIIERLSDETINENRTYHYTVKINKEMVQKILEVLPESIKQQNNSLDQLETTLWEIWIGKKDRRLYKLTGQVENESVQTSFNLTVSQFNQVVTTEEPTTIYSMTDFSRDLFGQTNFLDLPLFGYLVGIKTQDLVKDTDEDGLYALWENVFGTAPDNPDTDEDGYLDGEEIRNGYNPKGEGRLFGNE